MTNENPNLPKSLDLSNNKEDLESKNLKSLNIKWSEFISGFKNFERKKILQNTRIIPKYF